MLPHDREEWWKRDKRELDCFGPPLQERFKKDGRPIAVGKKLKPEAEEEKSGPSCCG
jgi:hypothetical protein